MNLSFDGFNAVLQKITSVKILNLALGLNFALILPSAAHEFWIAPLEHRVGTGQQIEAHLRNGQYFEGSTLSYLPRYFRSFERIIGDNVAPIKGTIGDRPAVNYRADEAGLHILAQDKIESDLTYNKWDKFLAFVEREGLVGTVETHEAKGWPKEGFKEAYTRYAKALVVVGEDKNMRDKALGQRLELIVDGAPWKSDTKSVTVQALWEGKPFAGRLLSVFRETGPEGANRDILYFDDQGRAEIKRGAGGKMLLGTVQMIEATPEIKEATKGAIWHSLWASTTFEWLDE